MQHRNRVKDVCLDLEIKRFLIWLIEAANLHRLNASWKLHGIAIDAGHGKSAVIAHTVFAEAHRSLIRACQKLTKWLKFVNVQIANPNLWWLFKRVESELSIATWKYLFVLSIPEEVSLALWALNIIGS